jgi:hypothetical protein
MAWYYYSGNTILSIPIGKGEVIAARPHSTIFVDPSVEGTTAFKSLGKVLRRTGALQTGVNLVPAQSIAQVPVEKPHLFSNSIVEGKAAFTTNTKIVADTPIARQEAVATVTEDAVEGEAPAEVEVALEVEADEAAADSSVEPQIEATVRRRRSFKTETN